MKNLFDPAIAASVQARVRALRPESPRQWGKMTPAQAAEHCAIAMEWAVGDTAAPQGPLPARILGRLIKPLVFRNDDPMRRDSPTVKSLIMTHEPNLAEASERLCGLMERFATGGATACTKQLHPFFGSLTPDEWAILMYKHTDHHLRQFGA